MKILISLMLLLPFSLFSIEPNPKSLSDFLREAKNRFGQINVDPSQDQIVHFVMGNESADLDSIASSIAYAYLLNHKHTSGAAELYIPLININRKEMALRKHVLYLFQLFNISLDDIIFLDDNVPLDCMQAQNKLHLILVDHNVLRPKQKHFANVVEQIIDHHEDMHIHYPLMAKKDKQIDVVGSNATLIAEKALFGERDLMFPELAGFLLAPILVDTSNMKGVETTCRDVGIVVALKDRSSDIIPQNYYERLRSERDDITGLPTELLLIKDFKEYLDGNVIYGISAMPPSVGWDQEDLEIIGDEIKAYADNRSLNCLIVLVNDRKNRGKRKMMVYCQSEDFLRSFKKYVENDLVLSKLLIPDFLSEEFHIISYRIAKPLARKQLQPLFNFSEANTLSNIN